jgi:serine protease Do
VDPRRPGVWMLAVAMAAAGAFLHYPVDSARTARAQEAEAPSHMEGLARIDAISETFRKVAKQVKPAVVQITSKVAPKETGSETESRDGRSPEGRRLPGIDPDELPPELREFFKDFQGRGGNIPLPRPQPRTGSGSGFIIDAERGLILTNNHVIGENDDSGRVDLRVKLADGRYNIRAKVVGQDPLTDIALIQIEADNLKSIPLGDSSNMEVGDWVLAIGAPFGLDQTVTQGIVSATGRTGFGSTEVPYQDWIQTDAAINPGNSGGPLVNMRGEVIGINVAIATSGLAAGYQGVGFAIPINTAKSILPDLREGRPVVRGYLGVAIQGLDIQPGLAETYGLKEDQTGVVINNVQPRTPASKAGLKIDDVILGIDDQPLRSASHLQGIVARTKPGTTINLKVWRDGKEITIPVTVEKQPADYFEQARVGRGRGGRLPGRNGRMETREEIESVGMTVEQLTPELAKKFGLDEEVRNQVVITEVEPLGEAAALGLSPGDIIVSVQDKTIKSTQALKEALSDEALDRGLRIQALTRSGPRILFLKIPMRK